MSHELTIREDGTAEYMYAGKVPWHGLGQEVVGAATMAEVITAAQLGWTVSKRELMTLDGVQCPEFFATVRDDNNLPLGMVGTGYVPTQINEVGAFIDAVVGTAKAKYVSAGSLQGGKRIFVVAQLDGLLRVKGDDTIERFLTFVHAHDGTLAHRLWLPATRVVCANTLRMAMGEKGDAFYARHSGKLGNRVDEAANILGFVNKRYALFEEQAKALAEIVVNQQQVEQFIRSTFQIKQGEEEQVSERKQDSINEVLNDFQYGEKNKLSGIAGTAWALLNATTDYADHKASVLDEASSEKRFQNIMFGSGADLKDRAFAAAMELVK